MKSDLPSANKSVLKEYGKPRNFTFLPLTFKSISDIINWYTSDGEETMSTRKLVFLAAIILITVTMLASLLLFSTPKDDALYQVSAFNIFASGNFDRNITFSELSKHGDFGIGTLKGLDGEMIALDGKFYQIPITGIPREVGSSEKTPYATISFFEKELSFQVENVSSYMSLTSIINSTLGNYDLIYAIRVHGFFDFAQTRSVPIQYEPYPILTEAVKNQTVFNLNGVEGTAAGFFFPDSLNGVDYIGYHLHFLTDDHSGGGHLLDCNIKSATVEIDTIENYHLLLP